MEDSADDLAKALRCGYAFCEEDAKEIAGAVVENAKLRAEHSGPGGACCLTFDQLKHSMDKMKALEAQVDALQKALYAHHWESDCQCGTLKVTPPEKP